MPFYKVPATSNVAASSSAPFATKHQSTNYNNSSSNLNSNHSIFTTGQSTVAGVDDVTWGDSSDRSVGSGGGGGGGGNLAELTEADRDSELLRRDLEHRVQLSQVERKKMDHVNGNMELFTSGSNHRRTNDVIEEELLAQHRREEELASRRPYAHHPSSAATEDYVDGEAPASYGPPTNGGHVASDYAHPGESRIVLELMEQRRRELELRGRWKEMGFTVPDEMNANETPFTLPEPKPVPPKGAVTRRDDREYSASDAAGQGRESTESGGMKVRPYEDPDHSSERKLAYIPENETPIEREIRLAGEREDALRLARGLLPLLGVGGGGGGADHAQGGRETMNVEIEVTSSSSNGNHYYHQGAAAAASDPSVKVSMKKLASNRLQLELLKEKEREVALRSQGAIHTISEERAGEPVKYVEVISKQLAESPTPIPFKCLPPGANHSTETKTVNIAGANGHHTPLEGGRPVAPEPPVASSTTTAVNGRTRHSISAGGGGPSVEQVNELEAVFGGRLQKQQQQQQDEPTMMMMRQKSSTTKPTAAERKILNELKEMQMREEELKTQRQSSTPFESFDANSSTVD